MSHEPASKGSVPPEAQSGASINETIPADQRAPSKVPNDKRKLKKGPDIGENGEYRPASYKLASGSIRTDR